MVAPAIHKMLKFPTARCVSRGGVRRFRIIDYTSQSPYLIAARKLKDQPMIRWNDRADAQRRARISGNHQAVPRPGRPGESRSANTEEPGNFPI